MHLIWENPYRVLGVWAGANDREIIRQKTRFKAYLKVNKQVETDTDLSFLPLVNRSETTVQKAISSVEKTDQKILHSLFWFSNLTPIDNTAINHLTNDNIDKATQIWLKPARQPTLSLRKVSALNNLSTLHFARALSKNLNDNGASVNEALALKVQALKFNSLKTLANSYGDETFHLDTSIHKSIVENFFQLLQKSIQSHKSLNGEIITSLIPKMDSNVRESAEKIFSGQSISTIESALSTAKKKRTDNSSDANITGKHLYSRTYEPLKHLENVLGHENMTYQMHADKVAQELIECGISYYNHHTKGYNVDPGDDTMNLLNKAKSLATGSMVKDRIKKNLPTVKKWQQNKESRNKLKAIESEFEFINNKLDQGISGNQTIQKAKDILTACKPKLTIIKDKLGVNSNEYIQISSNVVSVAQSNLVFVVNKVQENANSAFNRHDPTHYYLLKSTFIDAYDVMESMRYMAMDSKTKNQFQKNFEVITSLKREFGTSSSTSSYNSGQNNSSGCYIATMAYGSYDHPQVLKLRHFRDNVLSKSDVGRSFIKLYYASSPHMVEVLSEYKSIHTFIRNALNKLIKLIGY